MDVAALYPNCKVKGTMLAIEEGTKLSGMNYERINKGFLTKFVSITTKGKSGNPRIDEFLQTPKPRTTLASWMKRKSETQFLGPPKRTVGELTPQDLRVMLGLASSRSTRHVMMNHFFSINGQIYRQRDGSPIDKDLSVEGASLYMILWDKKFMKKLKTLGINLGLYKRYVDDIVVGLRGISPGWFFDRNSNRMKFDAQNQYTTWESDARTLAVLRDIANSLDSDIQFETDVPSAHQSGFASLGFTPFCCK